MLSGAAEFHDTLAVALDGEPHTPFSLPSGDGQPGGSFLVDFEVDQTTPLPPNPFLSLSPLGGLTFLSTGNTQTINGAADQDAWSFFVEGRQWLGAVATPSSPGVALTLALDGGQPVGGSAGQAVVLAPQFLAADGTHTLQIGGSGLSKFTLEIYRNASLEALSGDTTVAQPLPIDNSVLKIASGTRYAVVGNSTPTLVQTSKQLTTLFAANNGQDGNMFDVTTFATPITVTSLDVNLNPGMHTLVLYTRAGTYVGYEPRNPFGPRSARRPSSPRAPISPPASSSPVSSSRPTR